MISIITPVYNGERFIESCIQNVISQGCEEIEHIIVDGKSSDATVDVIKTYASTYPHIRWISEKDHGQSDAMNKGLALSRGEIIGYLNVDDFYSPNVLNRVLEIFSSLPDPSFLVGNCHLLNDEDKIIHVNKPSDLNVAKMFLFKKEFPLNPSAYFYHKSLHNLIGEYNIQDHYMMDLDFIVRTVQKAYTRYIDEDWGNHRHIDGTKTVELKKAGQHAQHFKRLINEHRKHLPLNQKVELFIGVEIVDRFRYFYNNPQDITKSLRKKMSILRSHT